MSFFVLDIKAQVTVVSFHFYKNLKYRALKHWLISILGWRIRVGCRISINRFWFFGRKKTIASSIIFLCSNRDLFPSVLCSAAAIIIYFHFHHLPQTRSDSVLIVIKFLVYLIHYFLFKFVILCKSINPTVVQWHFTPYG